MPTLSPHHSEPRPTPIRRRAREANGLRIPSGRSREGRELLELRRALIAHIGGKPSATQMVLINRCVMLQLHLNRLDEQAARGGSLSEHATKSYLAWTGTLARTLRHLGLQGTRERPPTIAEIMGTAA